MTYGDTSGLGIDTDTREKRLRQSTPSHAVVSLNAESTTGVRIGRDQDNERLLLLTSYDYYWYQFCCQLYENMHGSEGCSAMPASAALPRNAQDLKAIFPTCSNTDKSKEHLYESDDPIPREDLYFGKDCERRMVFESSPIPPEMRYKSTQRELSPFFDGIATLNAVNKFFSWCRSCNTAEGQEESKLPRHFMLKMGVSETILRARSLDLTRIRTHNPNIWVHKRRPLDIDNEELEPRSLVRALYLQPQHQQKDRSVSSIPQRAYSDETASLYIVQPALHPQGDTAPLTQILHDLLPRAAKRQRDKDRERQEPPERKASGSKHSRFKVSLWTSHGDNYTVLALRTHWIQRHYR